MVEGSLGLSVIVYFSLSLSLCVYMLSIDGVSGGRHSFYRHGLDRTAQFSSNKMIMFIMSPSICYIVVVSTAVALNRPG